MKTIQEQLAILRLDMEASARCNDTGRLLENMDEILNTINTTKITDLDLGIIDRIIYIFLRNKLRKLITDTCLELRKRLTLEVELKKLSQKYSVIKKGEIKE